MKKLLSLLVVLLIYTQSNLSGQSISEQTDRRKAIEMEIEMLDKQLAATRTEQRTSTRELNLIQRKITNRRRLLSQIESDVKYIETRTQQKEREVEQLHLELENLRDKYRHLVYTSYKNRDKTTWMLYLLASKNIEQGYRRWSYLKNYSETMKRSAQTIREKSEELEKEIERLEEMREESLAIKMQREAEFRSLAQEEKRATEIINSLSRREREFRNQIAEKRREVERLNREIERLLAEATREKKEAPEAEVEAARVLSGIFENNRGKLPWPVKDGVIIEQFGQHNHPVFRHIKLPFNNGVNIATSLNAPVMAVFDGVVKQILVMPGYNQCVLIQHGNYYTFYTKMEKVKVSTGDNVKTGEVLGLLAESEGSSVIHFQLWHGTTKQNPEHWISR